MVKNHSTVNKKDFYVTKQPLFFKETEVTYEDVSTSFIQEWSNRKEISIQTYNDQNKLETNINEAKEYINCSQNELVTVLDTLELLNRNIINEINTKQQINYNSDEFLSIKESGTKELCIYIKETIKTIDDSILQYNLFKSKTKGFKITIKDNEPYFCLPSNIMIPFDKDFNLICRIKDTKDRLKAVFSYKDFKIEHIYSDYKALKSHIELIEELFKKENLVGTYKIGVFELKIEKYDKQKKYKHLNAHEGVKEQILTDFMNCIIECLLYKVPLLDLQLYICNFLSNYLITNLIKTLKIQKNTLKYKVLDFKSLTNNQKQVQFYYNENHIIKCIKYKDYFDVFYFEKRMNFTLNE